MVGIGNKIKEVRTKKGISQDELAELTNINLRTIQRIESNESKPRAKTLSLICDALGINITEITENKNDIKNLILPIILTSVIFISTFLSWNSFIAKSGHSSLIGKTLTTTGWEGSLYFGPIKIYNWLVSLCSLSIGAILILTLLDIIKKNMKLIIVQLSIILIYILFYVNASLNHKSIELKYGLFLVITSTIGLSVLHYKTGDRKENK